MVGRKRGKRNMGEGRERSLRAEDGERKERVPCISALPAEGVWGQEYLGKFYRTRKGKGH